MSNLENSLPLERLANTSSTRGKGYESILITGLIVTLKSPQIRTDPSRLTMGTIGAAQSEYEIGEITPSSCNLHNSVSTFFLITKGTTLGL